ncbi:DNA-directed RNA polymerase subunit alpha [Candidatus Microgenomates bacterium]|nr:DNA-directed RNA polymerase subunit alpha [Candidatus Microgenomates bacterium]
MVKTTMHVPEITTTKDDGTNATFVVEPLHRGFGVTLGNSLRRVLMSSLDGAAVTAFKIEDISHEFSTLPGVKEDVVQITLNLKQLRFRLFSDEPQTVEVSKKGKGPLTGADIKTTADIEVVNPQQLIATLDNPKSSLNMFLRVEKGRGYSPVEERKAEELEVGMIAIDALFSPTKRVRYKVERTRVGQVTDLDKLTIDVATDGSMTPTDALQQGAAILVEQFAVVSGEKRYSLPGVAEGEAQEADEPAELNFGVEDLNLSPRTTNALMNNNITTVRDLIGLSDSELKNLKGFGAKAYQEVIGKLKELELR